MPHRFRSDGQLLEVSMQDCPSVTATSAAHAMPKRLSWRIMRPARTCYKSIFSKTRVSQWRVLAERVLAPTGATGVQVLSPLRYPVVEKMVL